MEVAKERRRVTDVVLRGTLVTSVLANEAQQHGEASRPMPT